MKMYTTIITCFLMFSSLVGIRQARLPDGFYVIGKNKNSTLFDPSQDHSIFYILVPAQAESAQIDTKAADALKHFTNNCNLKIPSSFFNASSPKKETQPLCIYFDWRDATPGVNHIKDPARQLAKGIDYLQAINSKCIVVTQGRGGLVLNAATHMIKKPLATVIQLGTPIPKKEEKQKMLLPKASNIELLYLFYTEHPFHFTKPSLHPEYMHTYPPIAGLNSYSILLLNNNKQPKQEDLFTSLIGSNLLDLCYTIKKRYQVNRDLFASLSPIKEATHLVVGIRQSTNKTGNQAEQEKKYSDTIKKLFSVTWNRPPALHLSSGEQIRSRYRFKNS